MCSECSLSELALENAGLGGTSLSFSGYFLESSHCWNMNLNFYANGNKKGCI